MPVSLYKTEFGTSAEVSKQTFQSPIVWKFPNAGGVEERKLFLRHENLSGALAESSSDVIVDPVDLALGGGDQSTWLQVAADVAGAPGTYSAAGVAKNLGNVNLGQVLPFWVKATVPVNTEVGGRDDLALQITSNTPFASQAVVTANGTYSGGASYNNTNNAIKFASSNPNEIGTFLSPWIDIASVTGITGVTYDLLYSNPSISVAYRTATNSSGLNPTAWFNNPADLDISKDWLQIKIECVSPSRTQWQASTDFSLSQQGTNNWYYQYASAGLNNYTNLGFTNTGNWSYASGIPPYLFLNAGSGHPDNSLDSVLTWIAPVDGVATVTSNGNVRKNSATGNGIIASIRKNDTVVWGSTLVTSTTGITPTTVVTSVVAGEAIRFRVGANGDNSNDGYIWDAQISLSTQQEVLNLRLIYAGTVSSVYDMRFYNGPATPELLSPPNGFDTPEFNPDLSAVSTNGDNIQFQVDNVITFNSSLLSQWEVPISVDVPVISSSPMLDRPAGQWYWRARSKLNGVYGNWSDIWSFGILSLVSNNEFLYIHTSTGVEVSDPLTRIHHLYLNVTQGVLETSIYINRHLYINVNVGSGVGEVIYPLYDRTEVRKTTFTEDATAFT